MTPIDLLNSRWWVVGRRAVLIGVIVFLAARNYGDAIWSRLTGPQAARDISVLRSEFRNDLGHLKPAWIIELENGSSQYTYEDLEFEATYFGKDGNVVERDRIVVQQRLAPRESRVIGSVDSRERPNADRASLRLIDAKRIQR